MKKNIIVTLLFTIVTLGLNAQEFVAPSKAKEIFTDTTTTFTYKMTDKTYKVYKTKTGAFYIWKTSKKTNKNYKMYLPKEIQIKMGRTYPTASK